MMQQFHFATIIFVLIGSLIGGTYCRTSLAQSGNGNNATVQGQLAIIEGEVRLKPKGSLETCRVSVGARFRRGDLLEVPPSARAVVVCADATKHELKNGVHGLPCSPSNNQSRVLLFDGAWVKVKPTRGEASTANIPIIVSPRKTKLLNAYPTLRWTRIVGITNYVVNVRGWNLDWTTSVGSKTEIPYPQDQDKRLIPNVIYKLTVKAGKYSSDDEEAPDLFFSLLSPEDARIVLTARQKITALGLPEVATKLLVAQLYAESELSSEAIEQLRSLPANRVEPAAAQLLGDLYFNIGLNRLAKEQYLMAVRLADENQETISQARARSSLGHLYEIVGAKGDAIKYWQQAKEMYQRLADTEMVMKGEEALGRLNKP